MKKLNLKHKIYIVVLLYFAFFCTGIATLMHELKPQLKEDSYDGYVTWGAEFSEKGYTEQSVKVLNTAIEMEPESEKAYIQLAEVYLKLGQYDKARQVYNDAIAKIGESYTLTTNLKKIDNVDVKNICEENSVIATTKNEDSFKYDLTMSYNSNGDMVYSYSRTRFMENPDLKSLFVYDENNNLLRENRYIGKNLENIVECTVYTYDDNNVVTSASECRFDGHIEHTKYFDETGFEYKRAIYAEDNTYFTEYYDQEGAVIANEYFDNMGNMLRYATYQPWTTSKFSEKKTYYNADGSMNYYTIYDYNSSIRSVKKETYFTEKDKVIISIQYKNDKNYYVYIGTEYSGEGTEALKTVYYDEALAFVNGYLSAM